MDFANSVNNNLKVVLLHDWLTGFRGGERVLQAFCEMFPTAPIYTLIYQKGTTSSLIESRKIQTSFLDHIPGIYRQYRKFLPLFPLAAESMSVMEDADLILSSCHCVIKGIQLPGKAKHISYIHSPMRYIYDQFDVYFGKGTPKIQRLAANFFRPYLQNWDRFSNENVDAMVANSFFVKERISSYYQRDSFVVHPFVELEDFLSVQQNPPKKENYYIMVTAFAPNKRADLGISAFNELKYPLKIVGSGQLESELKSMAGANIEFLGNRSRKEIISLLAGAKGFIFPGIEDFGITPLESLAAGTPVIAFKKGGVLESLNEGVAVFFNESSCESLIKAIKELEGKNISHEVLFQRAQQFSKEKFKNEMMEVIRKILN